MGNVGQPSDVRIGDVIQFRDYQYLKRVDNDDGSFREDGGGRPHHTAIVERVDGNGAITVLEQNFEGSPVRRSQLYFTSRTSTSGRSDDDDHRDGNVLVLSPAGALEPGDRRAARVRRSDMAGYKNYLKFVIEGTQDYIARTTACFDVIEAVDAKAEKDNRILRSIDSRGYIVAVKNTTSGNACRALGDGVYPVMSIALYYKRADDFTKELNAAVDKAKKGGLTLEHLARQLAIGLSPATYTGARNVGAPTMKKAPPASATGRRRCSALVCRSPRRCAC